MTEAERTITTPDTPGRAPDPDAQADPGSRAQGPARTGGDGRADSGAAGPTGPGPAGSAAVPDATDASAVPDATGAASEAATAVATAAAVRGRRRVAVLAAVAAFAYVLDQLSKLWVVHSLEHHQPVNVLGHYLRLEATRNGGAAFGLGQGMTIVFTVIAAGVIAVIIRLSRKLYSAPWAVALGLLLGGALGNLTDRIFRSPGGFQGWVVDFVHPEHFAIFNLADSAICCGGALIVLLSFRGVDPDGTKRED